MLPLRFCPSCAARRRSEKIELTFLGLTTGGENVRADYTAPEVLELLLTALMPPNRLALQASMVTGLRIGDVLALRTAQMRQRMTITERKTGKRRRVYWPRELLDALLDQSGRMYVFEGRSDVRKHRTRQAVYKDLRRVAEMYRIDGRKIAEHISPHTARKVYAVSMYHSHGSVAKVQELLQHSDEAVTMIYAMADAMTAARLSAKGQELASVPDIAAGAVTAPEGLPGGRPDKTG